MSYPGHTAPNLTTKLDVSLKLSLTACCCISIGGGGGGAGGGIGGGIGDSSSAVGDGGGSEGGGSEGGGIGDDGGTEGDGCGSAGGGSGDVNGAGDKGNAIAPTHSSTQKAASHLSRRTLPIADVRAFEGFSEQLSSLSACNR